jgi:PKD repeat protein
MNRNPLPSCAVVVLALTAFANLSTLAVSHATPERTDLPNLRLPAVTSGREAVSALGRNLPQVARAYGLETVELTTRLQLDRSLHVDRTGRLLYVCAGPAAAPASPTGSPQSAGTPVALADTFALHSLPGASKVIYLDFDGHTTSGTIWNNSFESGLDFVTPPYDLDGNPAAFSDSERERIQYIWQRVAEDYAPFGVDVTTEDPGLEALRKTSSSDAQYGVRVCVGGSSSDWYGSSAGGVAFVGSYIWASDTPAYVFPAQLASGAEKYVAEAISHEAGHTLGLSHDGVNPSPAYYSGHGSGATGWAPIMGVGYYQAVTQWSKGEYLNANNLQDDIAIITSVVGPRADDHGDTLETATFLPAGPTLSVGGIVGSSTDVDVVAFTTAAGSVSLQLTGDLRAANLDAEAELRDAAGNLVALSNPVTGLGASFDLPLEAGTYFVVIHGTGVNQPTNGYSSYGSLGQFTLKGFVADPSGGVPPVAVATATPGTGVSPVSVTFTGAGSFDQDGFVASHAWTFSDGTSAIGPVVTKLITTPGVFSGTLVVTDNAGFTASSTVSVTIQPPNLPPVAVIAASATTASAPAVLSFNGAGSYDPDGTVAAYAWTFGDGTQATGPSVTKTYGTPGSYTVQLTVTDNRGLTASRTLPIVITADPTKSIRVESINVTYSSSRGRAVVKVTNLAGQAVRGVTVSGRWSGALSATVTTTTDSAGLATLSTPTARISGTLTFEVTNLAKTGLVYLPSQNLITRVSIQAAAGR